MIRAFALISQAERLETDAAVYSAKRSISFTLRASDKHSMLSMEMFRSPRSTEPT